MYHEGEIAVQRAAGVEAEAARVGRIIGSAIPPAAMTFLEARTFIVVATVSADQVTASFIGGDFHCIDEQTLRIEPARGHLDRVRNDLAHDPRIGILAIDFPTRRRMRLNGDAHLDGDAIVVTSKEVYSNCPQYIHQQPRPETTFFIASMNPNGNADASHRGGEPGFVTESATQISFPDYRGNNMFNTLGNLTLNPNCGLLFIDFATMRARQINGRATIEWSGTERRPDRRIDVAITALREETL